MGNRGRQPVVLSYIRVILDLSRPYALELRFPAVDENIRIFKGMIPELLHLEVRSNFGWTRFFAPPFINFLKKVEPKMAKYRRFWPFWASYIGI